jgi:uncharacterized protein (TIGR00661 family)
VERERVLTVKRPARILVAPLDWGLGHATRCIPIIRELQAKGGEVVIAADGRPLELLKKEFPSLTFVRFPGFSVMYPDGNRIASKIVSQIPKIVAATFREHRELKTILRNLKIDAVISDNRFGLFSKQVPCIFVTHQIGIAMPKRLQWAARAVYYLNKMIIRRYTECWIPDYAEEDNLSGKLSHYYPLPKNANFIGPLTRFKRDTNIEKEFDILVLLSGPEPQRTVLETIIMEQLKTIHRKSLVVRGIPERNQHIKLSEWITVVSSLDSGALNHAMLAADIIISRPGYSTIMDLNVLGKRAIFIPTPGQTEQEYLADELQKSGKFSVYQQDQFSLSGALEDAKKFPGFALKETNTSDLNPCTERLLARIDREQLAAAQ